MHEHVNLLGRQRKEMMRLDELKALVHHGCGVDGDFRPHGPVRMTQGLFGCRGSDRLRSPSTKWSARCGKNYPADVVAMPGAESLKNRIVLGVDRQHGSAGRGRVAHENRSGAD